MNQTNLKAIKMNCPVHDDTTKVELQIAMQQHLLDAGIRDVRVREFGNRQ